MKATIYLIPCLAIPCPRCSASVGNCCSPISLIMDRAKGVVHKERLKAFEPILPAPQIVYPFSCLLCRCIVDSADDLTFWHGYGNCVELTTEMLNELFDEYEQDQKNAGNS